MTRADTHLSPLPRHSRSTRDNVPTLPRVKNNAGATTKTKKQSNKRPGKRAKKAGRAKSRRDLIAEAVITLLAREGGRGLSHRNVDRLLKLPVGSTSFYFRRRADLFEAGLRKLIEEDLERLGDAMSLLVAVDKKPLDLVEVAQRQFELWRLTTKQSMRSRALARFEFFLQAARDPKFAKAHAAMRKDLFAFGASMFERLGAKNPGRAAIEYGYLFRGDTMAHFLLPRSVAVHKITPAYFETQLAVIISETNKYSSDAFSYPD